MSTDTRAFHPEKATTLDVSCLGCRAYQRCVCQPKQSDTPVQIRRARGAFIRARGEEDIEDHFVTIAARNTAPNRVHWVDAARHRQEKAEYEYARAVCHALQWLLG